MLKRSIALWLFLIAAPVLCAAQTSGEKPQPTPQSSEEAKTEVFTLRPDTSSLPPALLDTVKAVELPQGKGAWVIQVATRGGFAGSGKGDVIVSSDGSVACTLSYSTCNKRASSELLRPLERSVREAKPEKWGDFRQGVCNDCYLTLLVLHRRGPDGAEQVYTVYWDDVIARNLPADVGQIYDKSMKVAIMK